MTLRRPQMTPRRAKRSPRRAKVSSGRLPGAFWEGFPTHFQATRGDRDAPYSNRRRGRVAPEQGYRLALRLVCFRSLPRDRARKLRKRRTRNSRLCLVVLCLASSRRCLCSSPRLLRRLRCLRLSLFTRFPFLDSQVSLFRCFLQPPQFLEKCNTLHAKTLFFDLRGVPKWSQNGSQNASKIKLRCGGPPGEPPGAIWEAFGGPRSSPEAPQRLPRASQESPRSAPGGPKGAPGGPK